VVLNAQRGKDARLLECADDPAPGDRRGPEARERGTVVRDAAAGGPEIAGDRVERGGLAGTVGADDAGNRAGAHLEGDALERGHAAESHGQIVDGEHLTVAASAIPARLGGVPRSPRRVGARCRGAGRTRAPPGGRRRRASATATTRRRAAPPGAR